MPLPFKMSTPDNIPKGFSWYMTIEDMNFISEQNEALIEIRGKVIAYSLFIEEKLNSVISLVFMGNNHQADELFKELLLEKEFFTYGNKWNIMREFTLRKYINFSEEPERKEFLSQLKRIIEIRNHFAHGEIVFIRTEPYLRYISKGEKKNTLLDEKYFDHLNNLFHRVENVLSELIDFLSKINDN